jgi:predicted MFS family arabinose efflux permease
LAALPVCLVVAAVGALTVLTGRLGIELAGVVLLGASSFGVPSLATALLRQAVEDDRRYTSRLSLLTAAVGIGQVLGPLLAGQVSDSGGLVAGTALAGVVLLLAALPAAAYGRSAARRAA